MSRSQQGSDRDERLKDRRGRASRTAADYDVDVEVTDTDVSDAEIRAVERLLGPLLEVFLEDLVKAKIQI